MQDAIDEIMKGTKRDPDLQSWYFDKLYADIYLMRGGTHSTNCSEVQDLLEDGSALPNICGTAQFGNGRC